MWGLVTGHIKRERYEWRIRRLSLVFLVTAVPWYALCSARNPDFLHTFFVMHNVERFTSPRFPSHATVLVLRSRVDRCVASVDAARCRHLSRRAFRNRRGRLERTSRNLFRLLDRIRVFIFQHFEIEIARIYFAGDSADDFNSRGFRREINSRSRQDRAMDLRSPRRIVANPRNRRHHRDRSPSRKFAARRAKSLRRWWIVAAASGGIMIAALGWSKRIAGALLLNAVLLAGLLEAANWK